MLVACVEIPLNIPDQEPMRKQLNHRDVKFNSCFDNTIKYKSTCITTDIYYSLFQELTKNQ